jgi:hypothetical protein
MPENDAVPLVSGGHARVYASTDMRHLILEISSPRLQPTVVRLGQHDARRLIGELQSGVDMIRAVAEPAASELDSGNLR